jgi:hypothetical protein|tara:strand:+ start:4873 stop:5061 length:189 start_codon:yes stop_codon:yes gene_type:complete
MVVEYKIVLDEKERDLLLDLIEHRVFLINSRIDETYNTKDRKGYKDSCSELNMLHKIGDRLT